MKSDEATRSARSNELRFGPFRLDRSTRRLRQEDGREVELAPRLVDALLYFVERPGQLLDKDQLLAALWPGLVVEENNVNQLVLALRRALGDDAQASRYIQTVPRRGFRWVAPVHEAADPSPSPPTPAHRPRPRWRAWWLAAGVALAVATVLAMITLRAPSSGPVGLAVLPFKPLSDTPRDDALEVGMADSLIVRLSALPGISVTSIGSARRYAGPQQDPLRAARELQVRWILDGSVQREGDRIRVTARLLDAQDGRAAWSGTFDDRFSDVFTVQDSISQRVAQVLAPQLAAGQPTGLSRSGTRNAEAYELYLTARHAAQVLTADGLKRSIALYERAAQADPGYAMAYTGLVETYRRMVIGSDAPPAQVFEPARKAAERALQIDPTLAEAHAALGWVQWWYDWDWPLAEATFRRAIELNPSLADAHFGLGHLLCSRQRCDVGLPYVRRARELDPLSLIANVIEASYLLQAGRLADSRQRVEHALQIEPNFWPAYQLLAGLAWSTGDGDAAERWLQKAQGLADRSAQPLANLAALMALQGRTGPARERIAALEQLSAQRYVPPTLVAAAYCALGDHGPALAWLDKARVARDVNLPFLTPCWFALRHEPRYEALRRALDLPNPRDGFCAPLQAPLVKCPV